MFGLTQSPFILEGRLKQHFQKYINEYPIVVENVQKDVYVDNLVSWGTNLVEIKNLKQKLFNLHKWHSNIPSLENDNTNSEQTFSKQLFINNSGHTKILGLSWNKITDKINIKIKHFSERQITKRNVLSYAASIYESLGLISASHIILKLIYRELCDLKIPSDEEIHDALKLKFKTMGLRYK